MQGWNCLFDRVGGHSGFCFENLTATGLAHAVPSGLLGNTMEAVYLLCTVRSEEVQVNTPIGSFRLMVGHFNRDLAKLTAGLQSTTIWCLSRHGSYTRAECSREQAAHGSISRMGTLTSLPKHSSHRKQPAEHTVRRTPKKKRSLPNSTKRKRRI